MTLNFLKLAMINIDTFLLLGFFNFLVPLITKVAAGISAAGAAGAGGWLATAAPALSALGMTAGAGAIAKGIMGAGQKPPKAPPPPAVGIKLGSLASNVSRSNTSTTRRRKTFGGDDSPGGLLS